ncbi:MAG TPA: MASE1 domain-containing protein [Caulobacteraceae bacterium]|jgi:two-component sensor histidine kinase/integral membrane sensor domain MASE1
MTALPGDVGTRPLDVRGLGLYLLKLAALAVAYAALAVFGLTWSVVPGAGTPIWPASGLALAALIVGGPRLWPGVFLGRLLAAILTHSPQPMWADALIAASNTVGALAPALVLLRLESFQPSLSALRHVLWLIAASAASALLSAGPSMLTLIATGTPTAQLPVTFVNWALGNVCGVLVLAPALLAWSRYDAWRLRPWQAAHLVLCLGVVATMSDLIFLRPPIPRLPTWYLFPFLVWAALAFSVRGVSLALLISGIVAVWSAVAGVGPFINVAPDAGGRMLLAQQFVAITALTMLVLAAVADERRGQQRIAVSEQRLREESHALETLNAAGSSIAAELGLEALVQTVTDAGVALTGAAFGAFFYTAVGPEADGMTLFSLSGAPREAFEHFGTPRKTAVFGPTFDGEGPVRSDDITRDPRYGHNSPHHGMPKGHLAVRSYLAVPVKSRTGEVIGGLFFGHPDAGMFTERAERIVGGIAAQAAIALDNARLYRAAQDEIAERSRIESRQELLINELNHRVKNTLATIQSIAVQTLRPHDDIGQAKEALTSRIIALARAHDVITARTWTGAFLGEVVARSVEPFDERTNPRISVEGPSIWLSPGEALAISMALHELGTNATKYGALSVTSGAVSVTWVAGADDALSLTWTERGGPPVSPPTKRGFGSRLIERGLVIELGGEAKLRFEPGGLICEITATLESEEGSPLHPAQLGIA